MSQEYEPGGSSVFGGWLTTVSYAMGNKREGRRSPLRTKASSLVHGDDTTLRSTVPALPSRRFVDPGIQPPLDGYGFLEQTFVDHTLMIEVLLQGPATLIVAPPWTGKTFVASALKAHYDTQEVQQDPQNPFGCHFHATMFESRMTSTLPTWWDEWRRGDARALWVIDAIDEDVRRQDNNTYAILKQVQDLRPHERRRLCLIMFTRENEEPPEVRTTLESLYPTEPDEAQGSFRIVRLAPLSASAACGLLGGDARTFEQVCDIIVRNHLQDLAGLPAVLTSLRSVPANASLTTKELWKRVLLDLLADERADGAVGREFSSRAARFEATSRIGAALALSGYREMAIDGIGASAPVLSDIIPDTLPQCERLRKAGAAACRTAVFQRTATGYRFSRQHVQEWFAAFALDKLPFVRLRPLVTNENGEPFLRCVGLLRVLSQITRHVDVRDGITGLFGGVPPCSDAAPSLAQSIAALDRLQELARQTPFGLNSVWHDRQLRNLASAGFGGVLAHRLADRSLSIAERRLIIMIASAITATEVAQTAQRLVENDSEPIELRVSAGRLLRSIGTDRHFDELQEVITGGRPSTSIEKELASVIISELLDRGIWTFAEGARHAPPASEYVVDTTAVLQHRLEQSMTVEDARRLVADADWEGIATDTTDAMQKRRGPYSLLMHAVDLIVGQDVLVTEDYETLLPAAIALTRMGDAFSEFRRLFDAFCRDTAARRRLVHTLLQSTPPAEDKLWRWRWMLTSEDAEWLEQIVRARGNPEKWMLELLLGIAYYDGVSRALRSRVCGYIGELAPELLLQLRRGRKRFRAQERRRKEQERKKAEEEKSSVPEVSVCEAAKQIIEHPTKSLQQRFWQLAWVCLTEDSMRPRNVVGAWDDLTVELREQVIGICENALVECESTPIPTGASYPGVIAYEAAAFAKVLHVSKRYRLEGEQIRRWLPSAFVFSSSDQGFVLDRCMGVDPIATEGVILREMERNLSSGQGYDHLLQVLPAEYWSRRMAEAAVEFVKNEALNTEGRCQLLRKLAWHEAELACEVARDWVQSAETGLSKWAAAIDVFIVCDRNSAFSTLEKLSGDRARAILEQVRHLPAGIDGGGVSLKSWSADSLERLAVLLHALFPAESDPQFEGARWVSPEDELRELRGRIHVLLSERDTPDDRAALGRLAAKCRVVQEWVQYADANRAAVNVIHPETIPVHKVIQQLDDARYRLVRSVDDLQRAVVDELREIQNSAREHLAALYLPMNPSFPGVRQHLKEDALQTYLYCRLKDRLPGRVLDAEATVCFVNREVLGTRNQRLDLKVETATLAGSTATVVIEVKWVNSADVGRALTEQLGKRYLCDAGLTHGVFVVGWAGEKRSGLKALGIPFNQKDSITVWLAALSRQSSAFQESHPGVTIQPFILDLQWEDVTRKPPSRVRRASRAS